MKVDDFDVPGLQGKAKRRALEWLEKMASGRGYPDPATCSHPKVQDRLGKRWCLRCRTWVTE